MTRLYHLFLGLLWRVRHLTYSGTGPEVVPFVEGALAADDLRELGRQALDGPGYAAGTPAGYSWQLGFDWHRAGRPRAWDPFLHPMTPALAAYFRRRQRPDVGRGGQSTEAEPEAVGRIDVEPQ